MMAVLVEMRWALRQFQRRPMVPLIIVLSLGTAMGVGASLFSLVNATWLKPWPVVDAHRLRIISPRVALEEWNAWPRQTRTFSALAADQPGVFLKLGSQRVHVRHVSANYFDVLSVSMARGRPLRADDPSNAAVISHELWQRRFGGDPQIVGRSVALESGSKQTGADTETVEIVGVASQTFAGLDMSRVHVWRLLAGDRESAPGTSSITVFGRLAPGVSDAAAIAELATIRPRSAGSPGTHDPSRLLRTDRYSQSPPSVDTSLRWAGMIGGVVFITLIACANVANLMLASGYARRGEIALRLSLGEGRGGIVRQLLIESLLLSLVGGALAIAIARILPIALFSDLVDQIGMRVDFSIDARVVLWSFVISLLACLVFGLVPALRSSDLDFAETLKESQGNSRQALVPSLLSYQTIVSVMAIVVAGLMLRSEPVTKARDIDRSLAPVSVVRLDPALDLDASARHTVLTAVTERLRRTADTARVAGMAEQQWLPGAVQTLHVTPEYFGVLDIPLLAGRTFVAADAAAGTVVVNESFARRVWPGRLALGQVVPGDGERVHDRALAGRQVIGVVGDAQLSGPAAYVPSGTADIRVLFVRAPLGLVAREAVATARELGGLVSLDVLTARDWVSPVLGPGLFAAWITTGFGVLALLLGVVGFFSLLEYSVQQRTREIGIRRAVGAGARAIASAVVVPATRPLLRGLVMGCLGAAALATLMRQAGVPAGIKPLDPVTYAAVAALLVCTAAVASYAPTRRALRIEPMQALRVD